ncbi:ATP-binding cassette domain-containing protein [Devosia algicola]|uniref:ATP-binding cassette domain-containing protein n=1 Tax=Devosia algicola TaxID=3026418 RepID=A0ABY7YN55_9HYPH|nr:ATP-binding cassette domain-containing protein [Devosia algicola]WDR02500.1 ATP-binding cassette domain-containing protein [Devosia algicola]
MLSQSREAPAIIEAKGLTRTFGGRRSRVEAVRGVDLKVHAGEIVGFLGPNGAGKTTTLKMLCTLLEPTGGSARVCGCELRRDPVGVRRAIGYVSQAGSTANEARAGEEIISHARLYGIDRVTATARARKLLQDLDLPDVWERTCGSLSGGQRRRLDIVMGLIHQPKARVSGRALHRIGPSKPCQFVDSYPKIARRDGYDNISYHPLHG